MTPRYATALFDLDGTIADTLPLIYLAFNEALHPVLGRELSPREIRAAFGPPDHAIIRSMVPAERAPEAIERYLAAYSREHDALVTEHDEMSEILRACKAAGMRTGVVTGKSRETAIVTLESLGLMDAIDVLYAGDDVERQKPDPEALVKALLDLGHGRDEAGVFIGDSAADVIAGRGAGLTTVAVTWGSPDHDELDASHPDITVSDAAALRGVLGV